MAGQLVQYATADAGLVGVNPLSVSLSGVAAGNVLMLLVLCAGAFSASDTLGGPFTLILDETIGGAYPGFWYFALYAKQLGASSGTETVTVNATQDTGAMTHLILMEWSGLPSSGTYIDNGGAAVGATNSGGTTLSVGPITTTAPFDLNLAIGFVRNGGGSPPATIAPPSGFTSLIDQTYSDYAGGLDHVNISYETPGTYGSVSASETFGGGSSGDVRSPCCLILASFLSGGEGAGEPPGVGIMEFVTSG